ncbi:MAG TPA: substrate-binding domain-containing protein [Bryobacteraceae bacterium]|jgi:DNA-binding LacI/PurR family transcriptional regulator|nr:substrate-binding domain-containing protein [Bryobacteraceae bacterium]
MPGSKSAFIPAVDVTSPTPKYRRLLDTLAADIEAGKLKPGDKLPSEAALVQKFSVSRITVGRALRELGHRGLIRRVAGSGTFVRETETPLDRSLLFGLLIPDFGETEIFEPICTGIANAPQASDHALLWGHLNGKSSAKEEQARELCRQYIARNVSGVFLAPFEFERAADKINRAILAALDRAAIPVVLLDHRPSHLSEAKRNDLVGLNNRQAGYMATEHLIHLGCKRIGFLSYHGSPSSISGRWSGYKAALDEHSLTPVEASSEAGVEGWVCVNDRVAGQLMHSLLKGGVRIPADVRIVGIDDVGYASLLPVPLTTIRQPCRAIGEAALSTMLDRIRNPRMPARDLLLDGELIMRLSCGGQPSDPQ